MGTRLGQFRLSATPPKPPTAPPPASDAPIVLFLPAHNEADAISECLAGVPSTVAGRRVECLVVDDGSTDETAARARAAGAEVISLSTNVGLGNAVRIGLDEAIARGAAAVAFCDADTEYQTDELHRLVEPILAGDADYVVGSRFGGTIEHMTLPRRVGNLVLTRALSFLARRPLTDGQSGYRALSPAALRHAEIIHAYNYAQVLTLDLLSKGFRYTEVPITYRFRTTGSSFVRLGAYLRNVVPAVRREIRGGSGAPAKGYLHRRCHR